MKLFALALLALALATPANAYTSRDCYVYGASCPPPRYYVPPPPPPAPAA